MTSAMRLVVANMRTSECLFPFCEIDSHPGIRKLWLFGSNILVCMHFFCFSGRPFCCCFIFISCRSAVLATCLALDKRARTMRNIHKKPSRCAFTSSIFPLSLFLSHIHTHIRMYISIYPCDYSLKVKAGDERPDITAALGRRNGDFMLTLPCVKQH